MSEKKEGESSLDRGDNNNHPGDEYLTKPSKSFSQGGSKWPFPRPHRSLVFLIVSVVGVECFIEIVLGKQLQLPIREHIIVDSALMVVLLLPFFYYFLYRPYKKHHEYHNRVQTQIHYLSRQLINTAESERKLLAQNLHDGFGQVLTSMQFGVASFKSSCVLDDDGRKLCMAQSDKLSRQISALGDFVRDVSTSLHPHMLDELGLKTTLKYHLDEFRRQYEEIKVASDFSDITSRFPSAIELVIFRVCQESLNNIVKHAKANNVVLNLKLIDGILDLTIKDDGEGFDMEELKAMGSKRSGIGLLGMRERVAAIGGRLFLDSTPGKGTTIQAKIPLELRRRKHEAYQSLDS